MQAGTNCKVMLVDDDRHLLTTLADFLTFEGFTVMTAESGEDALRQLAQQPPDIVVLDVGMPGMGGLGFLREIADANGTPRYPVLILTARGGMEGFFDAPTADGFLVKPCAGVDLVREIRAILTRRKVATGEAPALRGRVLLVENHQPTADRLSGSFIGAGFAVQIVQHGLEMFRKASEMPPDVIVSKEMLPTMKGSAVALMARGHRVTHSIPFVLYDGSSVLQDHVGSGNAPPQAVSAVVLSDDESMVLQAVEGVLETRSPPRG